MCGLEGGKRHLNFQNDQLADAKIGQLSEFLKPEKFGLWLIRIYLRFES